MSTDPFETKHRLFFALRSARVWFGVGNYRDPALADQPTEDTPASIELGVEIDSIDEDFRERFEDRRVDVRLSRQVAPYRQLGDQVLRGTCEFIEPEPGISQKRLAWITGYLPSAVFDPLATMLATDGDGILSRALMQISLPSKPVNSAGRIYFVEGLAIIVSSGTSGATGDVPGDSRKGDASGRHGGAR